MTRLTLVFKAPSLYKPGQGYRYQSKFVQVSEVIDGKPVFKTLTGGDVEVKGGVAMRCPAYDKLDVHK